MAKLKLKKEVKYSFILIIILIIAVVIGLRFYQDHQWRQTFEFRLLEIEYNEEEVAILIDNLNDERLEYILTREQDSNIPILLNEQFFIWNNLDRYLAYKNQNRNMDISLIITRVNVNRDRDFYEAPVPTDISRGYLMLVNKYHYLDESYQPELVRVSPRYAFANIFLIERTYQAFRALANEARDSGHVIVINSGFRSYETQRQLWENLRWAHGIRHADSFAARAGHSEHQTGFAIDVADFHDSNNRFGDTQAYQWMLANAHRFGFILRYPADKEDITGYSYEPWHFRYIGIETATRIRELQITFDEYYAFFIAN
jgi:LAS superfamily LD-carboxypeptidase LdcB